MNAHTKGECTSSGKIESGIQLQVHGLLVVVAS